MSAIFSTKGASHTSLGQRPRYAIAKILRAESPVHSPASIAIPSFIERMERAVGPRNFMGTRNPGRCPGLVWQRAVGPLDHPIRRRIFAST